MIQVSILGATDPLPHGTGLDGETVSPFDVSPQTKAVVFFFTAADCPISNRYAPRMTQLAEEFAPQGIESWLVYSDDLADPATIKTHQEEYRLRLPVLLDRTFAIADFARADVTPEAAVFVLSRPNNTPTPVYLGRLDDQYQGFGKYRPAATKNELYDLLTRVANGETPAFTKTKAIGCYIPNAAHAAKSQVSGNKNLKPSVP